MVKCKLCDKFAVFGNKTEKAEYCKIHKTAVMIDVKSKLCEYDGCFIRPTFDIKGGKGRYCVKHKSNEMIDVKFKKCENCDSKSSFDIKGGKGRTSFKN